jgi:hypothetical protein
MVANRVADYSYFAQNPVAPHAGADKAEASLAKMFEKYRGEASFITYSISIHVTLQVLTLAITC